MPYPEVKAILTDIGTEELAHLEMVSTIVYQLTKDLTEEEIQKSGFDTYFVDHTTGVYPTDANGMPFSASTFSVAGDALTDLTTAKNTATTHRALRKACCKTPL